MWPIRANRIEGDALRVRARSKIARTRALFDRFSAMSEIRETEMWSKVDLNSQPLFSSSRRQLIVRFRVSKLT
jgi:hypothetical protein